MKNVLRMLSLLLCMAMLISALPADALFYARAEEELQSVSAEEYVVQPAETVETVAPDAPVESAAPTDAPEPAPSMEPSAEPSDKPAPEATTESSSEPTAEPTLEATAEPSAEPTVEPTAEPSFEPSVEPTLEPTIEPTVAPTNEPTIEPTVEPTAEPTVEPTPEAPRIDYTKDAGESPAFESGYAELISPDTVIYVSDDRDADEYAKLGRGVVYAISRSASEPDRLEIAFNADPDEGIESAWVDAEDVRPMNPAPGEELEHYIAACAGDRDVRHYKDNPSLPLRVISCAYPKVEIYLNKSSAVIGVDDSGLDLDVVFSDGGDYAVRYESSKSKYASVDAETGVVTGERTGSAVIRAITEFGTLECAVTVKKEPRSVSVSPKEGQLAIGEAGQLKPSFGSSSYGGTCRYESSDPDIASVDENGVVTGLSKGTAVISVYVYSQPKKPAKATIHVLGSASEIFLPAEETSISRGMSLSLAAQFLPGERDVISYSSSAPEIASVDEKGDVQALNAGTAVITAETPGGVSAACTLHVLPAPVEEEVVLLASSCKIGLKESFNMMELLQVSGEAHVQFSFESSKPKYASVDAQGNVKGLKKGSCTIRATTQNGIVRDVKLTVCSAPKSVSFAEDVLIIGEGMEIGTELEFYRSGSYSRCSYRSSDESVATVDARGVVTGVSEGMAIIKALPLSGNSGSCRVYVRPAPESISVEKSEIILGVGEPGGRVTGLHGAESMCSFSYASMNEDVVQVDEVSGELTALAMGSADVVVRAHNGPEIICHVQVRKAPESIELMADSIRIMEGERFEGLEAMLSEGSASALTLESSKTKYAKIENGAIVGVREGKAVITVSTYNGHTASCKVTVCEPPRSIAFGSEYIRIGLGDTVEPSIQYSPSDSYSPISYYFSNEDVLRYDEATGRIIATGYGVCGITAKTLNGKDTGCTVYVLREPESITAEEPELRMGVGEKGVRVQGVAPVNTICSFSYESLNPEIARVDSLTGELTALSAGTVEIRISAQNGVSAICTVHVMEEPRTLTLSHDSLKIIVGERNTDLRGVVNEGAASELTFESSRPKYVKIEDGAIVGVRVGSATITVSTYNGVEAQCKVTVTSAPTAISFDQDDLKIGCHETVETRVRFRPSTTAGRLRYESDRPDVATVDPDTGIVQGVNVGTAVITATSLNGLKDECRVQVCPAPSSLKFETESCEMSVGMSLQLKALLSEGAAGSISYRSADPSIADVDANGLVTAHAEGAVRIIARSYNGFTAECSVQVVSPPVRLYYEFESLTMLRNDAIPVPVPVAVNADGKICPAGYSYSSSRSSVASINADGFVSGLKNGTVKIKAESHNGLEASFELVVSDEIPPLVINPASGILYTDGVGYAETLRLESNSSASLSYSSNAPHVASVDENGVVSAVGEGQAIITARALNGSFAKVDIRVLRLTSSITLDMAEAELGVGEKLQLTPGFDPGTHGGRLSYSSDNPAVAQVDENGLVQATGVGSTLVTAATVNGHRAVVRVDVIAAPDSVELGMRHLLLAVGEEVILNPVLTAASEPFCKKLRYSLEDPGIAALDAEGRLLACAAGITELTVETCNGLKDSCIIEVVPDASMAAIGFHADTYSIVSGDHAELPAILNLAAFERGFSVSSSDPDLLQVNGLHMSANPLRAGEAVITLTVNPDPAMPDMPAQSASCTVSVVSYGLVELASEEISVAKGETALLQYSLNPANLIGSFGWEIADPELISYDPESGLITAGMTEGETEIRFHTYNDAAVCRVIVTAGTKYRALIIGEYNNAHTDRDLPFAENNLQTMKNTLAHSSVNGEGYEITTAFNNPSKGTIRSLLLNTFADADEDDVSLIYIMSHGYYGSAANGYYGYYFSLSPNYDKNKPSTYVTADELMAALRTIPGRVIFVLDSCKSGGFIRDCKGELAELGNIAVFTAQTYDKPASFYVGRTESTTVEFFTYALCYGLGVQQRSNYLEDMPADDDGDGYITANEAFGYARSETRDLIDSKIDTYEKGSKYGFFVAGGLTDGWSQNPQKYIPDALEELVFYGREMPEVAA